MLAIREIYISYSGIGLQQVVGKPAAQNSAMPVILMRAELLWCLGKDMPKIMVAPEKEIKTAATGEPDSSRPRFTRTGLMRQVISTSSPKRNALGAR